MTIGYQKSKRNAPDTSTQFLRELLPHAGLHVYPYFIKGKKTGNPERVIFFHVPVSNVT